MDAPRSQCQTTKKWAQAVTNATETLRALRLLAAGQIRHCLLRHCLDACKVNHLMRAAPSKAGLPFMEALSRELKIATCDLVGCGLTASAWEQATLPIAQGGLGIRDPLNACVHARTAALSNFHQRSHHVGMPSEIARALAPDQDDTMCALATLQACRAFQCGPGGSLRAEVLGRQRHTTTMYRRRNGNGMHQPKIHSRSRDSVHFV